MLSSAGKQGGRTINRIVLSYAMIDEARPLIERLQLTKSPVEMSPFPVYQNDTSSIFLVANGKCDEHKCDRIGTQWSTLSTYLAIHTLSPDVIINAGTCGGVVAKYCFADISNTDDAQRNMNDGIEVNIGDVFVGESCIYSDRRIHLKPWDKWGIGHYPLIGAAYLNSKIDSLKIAPCIATSNTFECTDQDKKLYKQHKVICKDMECAAIAEMCKQFGCNLIAIKGVTDLVEHHDVQHFLENLQTTVDHVTDRVEKVVDVVLNASISKE